MAAEFHEAFLLLDDASLLDAPSPSAAIAERAAQASEPGASSLRTGRCRQREAVDFGSEASGEDGRRQQAGA
uniref:ABC transporter ATP-binding protein n=1 Tax=Steinernema glaseri TaxID=37863 RepID=A0A1I8A2R4_9BILA